MIICGGREVVYFKGELEVLLIIIDFKYLVFSLYEFIGL